MEKELKDEAAMAELQAIVRKMENYELDIDQMAEQLKRAQELIKLCKDKLLGALQLLGHLVDVEFVVFHLAYGGLQFGHCGLVFQFFFHCHILPTDYYFCLRILRIFRII